MCDKTGDPVFNKAVLGPPLKRGNQSFGQRLAI